MQQLKIVVGDKTSYVEGTPAMIEAVEDKIVELADFCEEMTAAGHDAGRIGRHVAAIPVRFRPIHAALTDADVAAGRARPADWPGQWPYGEK